jgi:hypothetical protein
MELDGDVKSWDDGEKGTKRRKLISLEVSISAIGN